MPWVVGARQQGPADGPDWRRDRHDAGTLMKRLPRLCWLRALGAVLANAIRQAVGGDPDQYVWSL